MKELPDFSQARVLVVGDVMLDRYWHGATSRISPEAPVPVVRVEQIKDRPGGAGNVALGAGEDEIVCPGQQVHRQLHRQREGILGEPIDEEDLRLLVAPAFLEEIVADFGSDIVARRRISDNVIAQLRGSDSHHPAQLAAAQDSDPADR